MSTQLINDFGKAARNGQRVLVEQCISKGVKCLDYGMYEAARGNHRDIIDLFIELDLQMNDTLYSPADLK